MLLALSKHRTSISTTLLAYIVSVVRYTYTCEGHMCILLHIVCENATVQTSICYLTIAIEFRSESKPWGTCTSVVESGIWHGIKPNEVLLQQTETQSIPSWIIVDTIPNPICLPLFFFDTQNMSNSGKRSLILCCHTVPSCMRKGESVKVHCCSAVCTLCSAPAPSSST